MGKERDNLLWQLGKKPNTMTSQKAYREYIMRRAKENSLPASIKKLSTGF